MFLYPTLFQWYSKIGFPWLQDVKECITLLLFGSLTDFWETVVWMNRFKCNTTNNNIWFKTFYTYIFYTTSFIIISMSHAFHVSFYCISEISWQLNVYPKVKTSTLPASNVGEVMQKCAQLRLVCRGWQSVCLCRFTLCLVNSTSTFTN